MNKLPSFRNEATSGPVRVVGPAVSPAYVAFEVRILSIYVASGSAPRRRKPPPAPRPQAPRPPLALFRPPGYRAPQNASVSFARALGHILRRERAGRRAE